MLKSLQKFSMMGLGVCLISSNASAVSLEKKLQHQFERYQNAQAIMLRMETENKFLTRPDFENILAPQPDYILSREDMDELKKNHAAIIQKNKEKAKRESKVSIDWVRYNNESKSFCAEFPKGGMLHIHPSGVSNIETVHKIMSAADPTISLEKVKTLANSKKGGEFYPEDFYFLRDYTQEVPYSSLETSLQNQIDYLFILPDGTHLFPRFQGIFSLQTLYKDVPNKIDYWNIIYNDFFARAAAQHVKYVEFTKTFQFNDKLIAETEELVEKARKNYGIIAKFNVAFIRTISVEDNAKAIKKLLELPLSNTFVGIDLFAEETDTPALENGQQIYIPLLQKIKAGESNLKMTMHAGEMGDVHNVRDALIMGVDRVGHGVKLIEDPIALEFARRKKTPIEINLVSNLRLRSANSIESHPFLKFLRLGLKPSLSTDDEGMFETDINRECVEAIDHTDIQYSELKAMAVNSIETSFASDAEKEELLAALAKDFTAFERTWTPKTRFKN